MPPIANYKNPVVFILFLFLLPNLPAQVVSASISGTVTDIQHAAIAGAAITVVNTETGAVRGLVTAGDGRFTAAALPVGSYRIVAQKEGFGTQQKTGITLVVGQQLQIDFALTVGQVSQEVTVEERPQAVNLSSQETSGLVGQREVKELPLNGRSFDQLMVLNPATVNYTNERSGSIGTSNSSVGNMFVVSGHRPQDNLFLLNGIEYTGASLINVTPGGTSGQLLGVDAVREFNVVSDAYGAEYGKRTGAQISIVTASGSNQIHGSFYEFLRNSALDARNYFDQPKIPPFQRNQFGAALGGPARKNKAFLFANYEGYRQTLGISEVTLVPDNRARLGYLPDSAGNETYVGVAAAAAPLLALWPVQNGPELGNGIGEAFSNPLQHIREDFGTARADADLSGSDTFSSVYTIDDSVATTPSANPLSSVFESLREQVLSLEERHVFSSNFLNTARAGFSRAGYFFNGIVPVNLPGWVAGKPIGSIVISGSTASNGSSQITLAGSNVGSNNSTIRNLFTYDDHAYWSLGAHQIEAGAWIQGIQANDNLAQNQYGQASFSTLADFLRGQGATFTVVPSPTELGWRSLEGAGFVQDTIHPSERLELRLGIRFESTDGWNEAHGRAANYLFTDGVIATTPFVGHSALTKNRAKFLPEPRIGFAYDLFGNGKTAVRGAFAVQRALLDTLDYRLDQTAPFNTTQTVKPFTLQGLSITPGSAPPAGSLISPSSVQTDIQTPTVLSWTLRVQQALPGGSSLTAGYVGSHGYHQILSADLNEPAPVLQPSGWPFFPPNAPKANPAVSNTTSWISRGDSSYNGLQMDLRFREIRGFSGRVVYTYSKNLDDGSAWNTSVSGNTPAFVSYPLRTAFDWGPAADDVRHLAAINATYQLPAVPRILKGLPANAVYGWTVSAIASMQTGFPFSPQLGYNPTGSGDSRNPVRPNVNPGFHGRLYQRSVAQYFNPTAFSAPAAGTLGNAGRDSLNGPGLAELDISALKETALTERVRLQFRAEFFNVLNRANFATPNAIVYSSATQPSPTAGVITATSTTARQIQFALKVLF